MSEQELITWLLNARPPSIRYQTLTDLLGYAANDARVVKARRAIMTEGPVPAILARQSVTGQWQAEHSYYTPKYVSTHWSMLLLAELNVKADEARVQQGARFMLDVKANDLDKRLDAGTLGLSCLWANVLRYALHTGKIDDARVKKIVHYATLDLQTGPCRCVYNSDHACAWGVARTLWGLAAIPKAQRTREVRHAIKQGVTFL